MAVASSVVLVRSSGKITDVIVDGTLIAGVTKADVVLRAGCDPEVNLTIRTQSLAVDLDEATVERTEEP